ncbi:MAG: hypothetical protein EBZ75_15395 [Oxalobacteraceae bacterium]|nr:hypothetical protein [Oxalobacteraceae bacterium]
MEAAGDLPARVVKRRKKGFELPFDNWLRGALRPMAGDLLRLSSLQGVIDLKMARAIWDDFEARRVTWSRAWALIVLAHWVRRNSEG